jgi:DNA-3-methyladenine glycosylase
VRRLKRVELPLDTVNLARYLIGKSVVHHLPHARLSGRIVETEAYPVGDAAGHAFSGQTQRNRSLFLRRGHAYVYFTYGSSYMLNVTSERATVGGGVLIRALEPLEGIELMKQLRATSKILDLTRGPGRLTQAMQIDLRLDGVDLCAPGPLWLGTAAVPVSDICTTTRIGLTREVERQLRFYECGNTFVSGPRKTRS